MADLRGGDAATSGCATTLTDLPESVAALVLARLRDPADVVYALCACRLFWSLVRSVPFRLRLRSDQPGTWKPSALTWIRHHLLATRKLDLAGCPIADNDVAELLADLVRLDCLVVDNCQKLTSAVADVLSVPARFGPRTVSLQRCYRLGPVAAGNLIAAASSYGSRLQAVFLSHLDGLQVPSAFPSPDTEQWSCGLGAGLQVLALNNCNNIGASELDAVATACPSLKVLMLGGSVARLGLFTSEDLFAQKVAAPEVLAQVVDGLKGLLVLELTFFSNSVVQAVRAKVRKGIHVWDFCDRRSVAEAAALLARCTASGSLTAGDVRGRAEEFRSTSKLTLVDFATRGQGRTAAVDDMVLALCAGANCSGMRQITPLHVAASSGDNQMIADLLFTGAIAHGKKDSGGATALFWAAEYGHAEACALLLKGGAELFARNRGGESPFYIAALMGHSEVVKVMVGHCREHHPNWEDASLYCDGWTPLMAATVADHHEVGRMLLGAIGAEEKGAAASPSPLLDAQNRYGLTALHIAARKPSLWFVENLLKGGASLNVRDNDGNKPLDVALQFGHQSVVKQLKQCGAGRRCKASAGSKVLQEKKEVDRAGSVASRKQHTSRQRWIPKIGSRSTAVVSPRALS